MANRWLAFLLLLALCLASTSARQLELQGSDVDALDNLNDDEVAVVKYTQASPALWNPLSWLFPTSTDADVEAANDDTEVASDDVDATIDVLEMPRPGRKLLEHHSEGKESSTKTKTKTKDNGKSKTVTKTVTKDGDKETKTVTKTKTDKDGHTTTKTKTVTKDENGKTVTKTKTDKDGKTTTKTKHKG